MNSKYNNECIRVKDCLSIIFLIFPFFSNYYQTSNNTIYLFFIIWKIVAFVFLVSKVAKSVICRCDKYALSLMLWMASYTISTLFGNNTSFLKLLGYVMTCLSTCFILLYYIQKKNELRKTIYALLLAFRLQVYINFILMLIFPNGIYTSVSIYRTEAFRYNFIGLDNQICPYVLTLLTLSMFYKKRFGFTKRYEGYVDIVVCIVSFLLLESATGYLGLITFFITWYIMKHGRRIFTFKRIVCLLALITIFVLFIRHLFLFSDLFALFGKDITLSGRTVIWQSAIDTILKKPILGYGITVDNIVYYATMQDYRSAHDEYLQIILNGGIIGFIAFIVAIRCIIKAYSRLKLKQNYLPLIAGFIGMLVMMITETYVQMVCFLLLMSTIFYVSKFEYCFEIQNEG